MRKNVVIVLLIAIITFLAGIALIIFYIFVSATKNPVLKGASVVIDGNIFRVEVASTTLARTRGLSGRDGLGEDEGMLFIFDSPGSYSFWMKDMKFAIDIIWIKGDRIVGFAEDAKPEPGMSIWNLKLYLPPEAVDKVLEVNAGVVEKYNFKAEDAVGFAL